MKFNLDGTRLWSVVGIVLLSLAATSLRAEQQWPSGKTVRIVVPYAPGGPGEAVIRLLAQEVSHRTKSNIVIEPRPGARWCASGSGRCRSGIVRPSVTI